MLLLRLAPEANPELEPTCQISIRLPNGDRIDHLFATHRHLVQDIRNFIDTRYAVDEKRFAALPEQYKLFTNFPKTELTARDQTLSQAGIINRSVLIVEAI